MATPTITKTRTTMEMTFDDATTDFVYATKFPADDAGLKVRSIIFEPSGADTMIIREGSVTGGALMRVSCADTNDQKVLYFGDGQIMKPCIEGDDITLTTPANAKVIFNLV